MNGKQMVTTEQANGPADYEPSGSLAVSLARSEVDLQITTARAYPRSISRAVERILTLATLDGTSAAECIYALPRSGKMIKGPSIRLAEIIASQWGNCRVGARVVHVDRFEKFVEAEGIFHDLETNMATTARIRRRIVDSKGRIYNDDMIVVTGNAACAIAKRNAILGAVPRGVWRKAYDAVESVISGDIKTLAVRRANALKTLTAEYRITQEQIFQALEIGGEEDIDLDRLSTLTAMRAALKNGEATVDEMFPKEAPKNGMPKGLTEQLDAIAAGGNGGNGDPPHDPDTGEIISDEMRERAETAAKSEEDASIKNALADPTGEEAARQLAARLEERATGVGGPREADRLQELLDEGRAAAANGLKKFAVWKNRLNAPDYERLSPHLEALQQAAAEAGRP